MQETTAPTIEVGQVWRSNLGGRPVKIVAIEGNIARVKGTNESKKNLANPSGGQSVALSEFVDWTRIP